MGFHKMLNYNKSILYEFQKIFFNPQILLKLKLSPWQPKKSAQSLTPSVVGVLGFCKSSRAVYMSVTRSPPSPTPGDQLSSLLTKHIIAELSLGVES